MKDLIRKRDIDYISAPIAPVLKGENVHYEYVAFRKQIEDIPPVPAIPIPDNTMIKALFPCLEKYEYEEPYTHGIALAGNDNRVTWFANEWWNAPYKAESEDK